MCEPTERLLLATAPALQVPITQVDAWRVRHSVFGLGWLEKSDPIDATLLRRYAVTAAVQITPPARPFTLGCATGCDGASTTSSASSRIRIFPDPARSQGAWAPLADCAKLENKLGTLVAEISATGLLQHLPDLGSNSDGAVAKLAGLAPSSTQRRPLRP